MKTIYIYSYSLGTSDLLTNKRTSDECSLRCFTISMKTGTSARRYIQHIGPEFVKTQLDDRFLTIWTYGVT